MTGTVGKSALGFIHPLFANPPLLMLWAQFQPQNDAEAGAFLVGIMIAGCVSGGIPFFTGLAMRQVSLGIAGGIVSGAAGALAGCCGGIPVAIICTMVIVWV